MSDKLIESFLKYEEQRKAQKSPNEFQNVKNLQEKVTRITASGGANTAQQDAGAGTGYTGGRQANTPVSTTTLSDFPSIENAKKIFGNAGLNPVGSIASGIGAAVGSIAGRLSSSDDSDEPRNQFPTLKASTPSSPGIGDGNAEVARRRADAQNAASDRQLIARAQGATPSAETSDDSAPPAVATPDNKDETPGMTHFPPYRGGAKRPPEELEALHLRYSPGGDPDGRTLLPPRPARAEDEAATPDITDGSNQRNPATPARPNDGNNRVSAPSQSTLNTRPGLKAGPASADTVKAFQRELGITADGIAGPQTRQAVMDFQRKHGLQVDGIIGDQTRMAFERMNRKYAESVQFSEAELAHFKSILEAMPVAPTAEGHSPNPTPKNKAEGGKGRGSLSEKMDPVGEEDNDVNNDGEENTDADKYLRRRRNAIADNMKKKK